jgi:hypothetical protein
VGSFGQLPLSWRVNHCRVVTALGEKNNPYQDEADLWTVTGNAVSFQRALKRYLGLEESEVV